MFESPREALRSAVALQLTFADEVQLDSSLPLLVGIGLDAGEAVRVNGGYRGGALNLAARLCSQAKAGEVLVSQGIVHLARSVDGIVLHDHGAVELKGLDEPVRVFLAAPAGENPEDLARRVRVDGRPPTQPSELPPALDPVTPIIGRDRDVRRLRWAWRSARRGAGGVVVITGPRGIGKTRLAAEGAGTAAAGGAAIAYTSFADAARAGQRSTNGRPAFVVLDDLESASPDELGAALDLASRVHDTTTLVVAAFDDEHASPELLAAVRRIAGEERVLRPQPLGFDEIRSIAALYLGAAVDALPGGLLESSGGVPRRVSTISFDPSGREFATGGGSGGFVKLWDTKTLQQLGATFPGEPGLWANGQFAPDGAKLVTLYDNGHGTVWPATVRAWEEHACRVAGRNFTREEWSRYVSGRSYSKVC